MQTTKDSVTIDSLLRRQTSMKKYLLLLTASLTLSVAHIHTNAQGSWLQKANFGGLSRMGAIGFSIGGKGYIGTGTNGFYVFYQDFWEWDPLTNAWTQKANFVGSARFGAVSFSIGSKGYVCTGQDVNLCYADFWEWDQITNTWTAKPNFPGMARTLAVGFSISNKGYVGTGADLSGNIYSDFYEWDQGTNLWTQKNNFTAGRFATTGFAIGSKGYVGTGTDGSSYFNDFWEYDPVGDVWVQRANFPGTPRAEATSYSIGTHGYMGAGTFFIGSGTISDFWEFSSLTNTWASMPAFGGGIREMVISFSIGCHGYIATGWVNDLNPQNDLWEFTPDTCDLEDIIESSLSSLIIAFPNPFSCSTTLHFDRNFKNAILTVYNLGGFKVKQSKNISGRNIVFHRDNLPSGLYFVRLTQDGKTFSADKFVIVDE